MIINTNSFFIIMTKTKKPNFNPRNDKIQAKYNHIPVIRSREEFLMELVSNSKNIHLE